MNFNEYQKAALDTAMMTARSTAYLIPGLCAEAGEVADKYAKQIRDGNNLDVSGIIKELGDVLWFVSTLAAHFNVSLEDVARVNIDKLTSRKERGVLAGSGDDR